MSIFDNKLIRGTHMTIYAKFDKFWPNIKRNIDYYVPQNYMNQGPRFRPFLKDCSQMRIFMLFVHSFVIFYAS